MSDDKLARFIQTASEATNHLTINELGDLVDYLGDGDMASIRQQSWQHHVASILPKADDADAIHTLWVVLIQLHSDRFLAESQTR
ncbi:MAG: hypothetical protein Q7K44_05300 [Candidatus Liptonbacteria bacterium]|nr:hypothetical protein [Candidatus Liptonbacteria bacterium]